MVAINTAGYLRRPAPGTGHAGHGLVDVMAASTTALRHVIVTAAVVAAAVSATPAAHADSVGDAMAPVLNGAGIGNNGPVSSAIAQVGQSICPMLVKPGSSFASSAAQVSGHGGLAPPLAGFLAGMAIQSQCPSFMTSVANGNMPFPIPGGTPGGMPFAPIGAPSPGPFGPIGAPGGTPQGPLRLPGL
jgi:hypothetical protein